MSIPSAIIFINDDLDDLIVDILKTQLFLDEIISEKEFINRITINPNYPQIIHSINSRILVLENKYLDEVYKNNIRKLADVVLFIKSGLIYILEDKKGPPKSTFSINNLNLYQILKYSNGVHN